MLKVSRAGVLAIALASSLAFLPPFNGMLSDGIRSLKDMLDTRPEQRVLFIGNSRTFYHAMPFMVRSIADSAGYPEKLHVEMDAQPGVSLAYHLESGNTQAQLERRWDHVVLQVLSSDQYSAEKANGAWDTAAAMIKEVQANGSSPAMFVTWRYTDQCTQGAGMPQTATGMMPAGYANMHVNIQQQHARLAALTGVDLVNVGLVWEELQDRPRDFRLYDDCNHPSIYGSYLSALMFYGYFSGDEVTDVKFKPAEVSSEDAKMLRTIVSQYFKQKSKDHTASLEAVTSR